jgi:hypothetical protein
MMYPNAAANEKIKAIDELLNSLPTEYIKKLAEADKIVDKLSGNDTSKLQIIQQLIDENVRKTSDILQLQTECAIMKTHLQSLVRVMCRPQYDVQNANDLQSLKISLGIYY